MHRVFTPKDNSSQNQTNGKWDHFELRESLFHKLSRINVVIFLFSLSVVFFTVSYFNVDPTSSEGIKPEIINYANHGRLLVTHVALDSLLALAYVTISGLLLYVVNHFRQEMTLRWVFIGFSIFIFMSGLTHVADLISFYSPHYYAETAVDALALFTSVSTIFFMISVYPSFKSAVARAGEEQREAQRKAEAMTEQLRRANHAKDEFLAIVSHELRTPMTAVIGWSQLLQNTCGVACHGAGTTLVREGLDQIEMACKTQARLIEDLLEMSRITLGQFSVRLIPCDFRQIVEETVESMRPNFAAKGVTLLTLLDDVGFVCGDPIRLRQVIWNILYNALKFTDAGTVTVGLGLHHNWAKLVVKDTGRGIDPDVLPTIFERLNRASGPPTSHGGGLGLGLSLSKTIIDLHAGHLYAESAGEGHGSTFTIHVPAL